MKNKIFRIMSIILYLISILLFTIYIIYELKIDTYMLPLNRVILLLMICLFLYLGSIFMSLTLNNKNKIMKITTWIFFIMYIILLITLVLFDSIYGRNISNIFSWNKETLNLYLKNSFNIIPFKTIIEYLSSYINHTKNLNIIITNLLGNIIAFTPFALFLPLLTRINNFKKFFITMLIIVSSVEILQFITMSGSCDIDDIILNVGGSLIMYKILNIHSINNLINKIFLLM